ncbi:hypothetical protein HY440_01285 [Candidatus Microgenomates bacterium]|nr:hypothetical protein [Candidatus Microgenomates bacterium]
MRKLLLLIVVAFSFFLLPVPASANHSWGGYHWARTANPFTLKLGNNTSGLWANMLATASSDWSQSTVLDTAIVPGGTKARNCRPTSGQDEICNANYGNTGWLGVAQIWITGGTHIYQGSVKNNDYYFGSSSYAYNNTAEMQHVICQEIGHTLGLDHQSTDGSSLNTCMDYYHNTSASDTKSTHPNQHDYDELAIIYAHLDSFTTLVKTTKNLPAAATGDLSNPSEWGMMVRNDAHESVFERELGGGNKLLTFVTWAR